MPTLSPHATYSVHPSVAYARAVLDRVPAKTGRSLDDWASLIIDEGPAATKERKAWLKKVYKLGGTTAALIVDHAEGRDRESIDPTVYLAVAPGYVDAMYGGPKAALRPVHDALIQGIQRRHGDIKICPCKTIVPIYRNHVIAQIKPATHQRLDFGLALKGAAQTLPARLLDTGGLQKGDRITHRFALTSLSEIDEELWDWLALAYGLDS